MSFVVFICGGRQFRDRKLVDRAMNAVHDRRKITTLITGGQTGAEEMVTWWAVQKPIERVLLIPPKSSSFMNCILRYQEIFNRYPVDGIIVFPGLGSGSYEYLEKAAGECRIKIWNVPKHWQ